jgi:hypothetical protein
VFFIDVISQVDLTVIIGIINSHNFNRDVINIFTRPSTITNGTVVWVGTIEWFTFSTTVFLSPVVFTFDETGMEFTGLDRHISVIITIFNQ